MDSSKYDTQDWIQNSAGYWYLRLKHVFKIQNKGNKPTVIAALSKAHYSKEFNQNNETNLGIRVACVVNEVTEEYADILMIDYGGFMRQ